MIPIEAAALAEALLGLTTNSEEQATRWSMEIIDRLHGAGFEIRRTEPHEDGWATR